MKAVLDQFGPPVHRTALAFLRDEPDAASVTRAVFQVFARHAHRFRANDDPTGWFVRVATRAATHFRETQGKPKYTGSGPSASGSESDDSARMFQTITTALLRIRARHADAIVAHARHGGDIAATAGALGLKPGKAEKRLNRAKRLWVRSISRLDSSAARPVTIDEALSLLQSVLGTPETVAPEWMDESFAGEILDRKSVLPTARAALRQLAWVRWKRRIKVAAWTFAAVVGLFIGLGITVFTLWNSGWLMARLIEQSSRSAADHVPELKEPPRPWHGGQPLTDEFVRNGDDLFGLTNIWQVHLEFASDQWKALKPRRIRPVSMFREDGTIRLRNPNAARNGLAGVMGMEFEWVRARFHMGGRAFENVAVRYRGNGTYLSSLYGPKQSFKVDLNKFIDDQILLGMDKLNFNNMVEDASYMHDALGYEFFRAAGVHAPRTGYAWLTVSVSGKRDRDPLGLYLLLENVGKDFAKPRFGTKKVPIFKPVTMELFKHLGDDWSAYADIYDLKTEASDRQKARLIDFSRLVTEADDTEFSRRVGDYLDLDQFSRYFAALVLLSSYDGLLSTGQNFYFYLDPESDKFGFMPWDLDHAWGDFPFVGTVVEREQASIWRPWASPNRFLERLMRVEAFRDLYKSRLDSLLRTEFTQEKLGARIDVIVAAIREAVQADSTYRARRFEEAVGNEWNGIPLSMPGITRPVLPLKRFIQKRSDSVRSQLSGESTGVTLRFGAR